MEKGQRITVVRAAGFLMVTMVLSRILGYLRDVFIYTQFGQNRITDAYNAAFSIPDFLYMLLVGGALSSAFIPVFSSYIATNREKEGWEVASIIFNWVMLLLTVGVTLGCIYMPQLIHLLVPGFDGRSLEMTIVLTRIMFAQVFFMCLSGISMGILNSYKHFTTPALGSVLYNLGIILGGLFLAVPIEHFWPGYGIAGFSVGVVIGSAINFLVQVPALKKVGIRYTFSFNFMHPGVKELILLIIPVIIGLSVSQINLFINQNLASGLPEGMVAALRTAQRIMQLPIGVFAIAIAVAVFPSLTAQFARHEDEDFKATASLGLRSVVFVTVPAAVGIAVLRVPIIRFMFEFKSGAFTHASTLATAEVLLYYCIGLFAYGAIHVLSRVFYSLHDTMTPVLAGIMAIAVNIGCSLLLVRFMAQDGLALAYSIAGIINMVVLLLLWQRKRGDIDGKNLLISFSKTVLTSTLMGLVVWLASFGCEAVFGVEAKIAQIIQIAVSIPVGVGVYMLIANLLKMEEADYVNKILKRRFRRSRVTPAE